MENIENRIMLVWCFSSEISYWYFWKMSSLPIIRWLKFGYWRLTFWHLYHGSLWSYIGKLFCLVCLLLVNSGDPWYSEELHAMPCCADSSRKYRSLFEGVLLHSMFSTKLVYMHAFLQVHSVVSVMSSFLLSWDGFQLFCYNFSIELSLILSLDAWWFVVSWEIIDDYKYSQDDWLQYFDIYKFWYWS
jgi:hypothetical protein